MRSWIAIRLSGLFRLDDGFSSYLYILKHSTATRVATYALVNPMVALFLGWLFLREAITLRTVVASAVILAAVLLVITAPHRPTAKTAAGTRGNVVETPKISF